MSEGVLTIRSALMAAIQSETAWLTECDRAIREGKITPDLIEARSDAALRRAKAEAMVREIDRGPEMIEAIRQYAANAV